ncbi:hypothetical protein V8E36_001383 [Tilletia maclaganii]
MASQSNAGAQSAYGGPPLRLRVRAAEPLPSMPFILPLPPQADYEQLEQLVRRGLAAHMTSTQSGVLLPSADKELILEQDGFRIMPIYRPADSLRDGDVIDVRIAVKQEKQSAPQASGSTAPTKASAQDDNGAASSTDDSSDSSSSDDSSDDEQPLKVAKPTKPKSSDGSSEDGGSSSSSSSSSDESSDSDHDTAQQHKTTSTSTKVQAQKPNPLADFPIPPSGLASTALHLSGLIPAVTQQQEESDDDDDDEPSQPLLTAVATRKLTDTGQVKKTQQASSSSGSTTQRYVPPGSGTAETARTNAQKKRKRSVREGRLREEALRKRLETGTWDYPSEETSAPTAGPSQAAFTVDRRPGGEDVRPRHGSASASTSDVALPLGANDAGPSSMPAQSIRINALRKGNRTSRHQTFTGRQGLAGLMGLPIPGSASTSNSGLQPLLPPGLGSLGIDDGDSPSSSQKSPMPQAGPSSVPAPQPHGSLSALDALAAFDQAKKKRLIQDVGGEEPAAEASASGGTEAVAPMDVDALRDIVARAIEEESETSRAEPRRSGTGDALPTKSKAKKSAARRSTDQSQDDVEADMSVPKYHLQANGKPSKKVRLSGSRAEIAKPIANDAYLHRQGFIPPSERPAAEIPPGMVVTRVDCDVWHYEHANQLAAGALRAADPVMVAEEEEEEEEEVEKEQASDEEEGEEDTDDTEEEEEEASDEEVEGVIDDEAEEVSDEEAEREDAFAVEEEGEGDTLGSESEVEISAEVDDESDESEEEDEDEDEDGDEDEEGMENGAQGEEDIAERTGDATNEEGDVSRSIRALAELGRSRHRPVEIDDHDDDDDEGSLDGGIALQNAKARPRPQARPAAIARTTAAADEANYSSDMSGIEFVSQINTKIASASAPAGGLGISAVPSTNGSAQPQTLSSGAAAALDSSPSAGLAQLAALRAKALLSKGTKAKQATRIEIPSSAEASMSSSAGVAGLVAGFAGKATKRANAGEAGTSKGKQGRAKPSLPVDLDRIPASQPNGMLDYGADSDSD